MQRSKPSMTKLCADLPNLKLMFTVSLSAHAYVHRKIGACMHALPLPLAGRLATGRVLCIHSGTRRPAEDQLFFAQQESLNSRTIEDELKSDPQLQKEVDAEISKGSYY